jgi:predicted GH43/DUF377 family glycosyl hydrolase
LGGLLLLLAALSAGCGPRDNPPAHEHGPRGTVAYSANPALAGDLVISATFDRPLAGAPLIEINRPGIGQPLAGPMTGAGSEWQFGYPVVPAGGLDLLGEPLTVVISDVVDQAGNQAEALVDRTAYVHAPAPEAVERSLARLEFVKRGQPVLAAGPPGSWDEGGISVGDVVKAGDTYLLYYSGSSADGLRYSIGLATSVDGLEWTKHPEPLISPGGPGEWNSLQVAHPSVLWEDGTYRMWYVGFPVDGSMYDFAFGYTTSGDGTHWQPAQPVFSHGPAGAWDEERIGGLDVVKVGDVFYLYYSATSLTPEFTRRIGCATSRDGETWRQCEANPLLEPQPEAAPFEGNEVESPNVISLYGSWLMAYTGYGGPQGDAFEIGLARSDDGQAWKRLSGRPVLAWGPPGSFDENGPALPALLVEGNQLWMWYTGLSDEGSTVAVAVALLD